MEKETRGKAETWSGRRLQEERCFQEEPGSPSQTCPVGKQQGTAHRMRHWGTLKATHFGNPDAAWPPGTPHGHEGWEWLRKSLAGGKNCGCGFVSSHQSPTPPSFDL